MTNKMNLKMLAISKNESFARNVVAGFCVEANPTIEIINDVKTAVSEAVTNSIVHAYTGIDGENYITINCMIVDKMLIIEISDKGIGIDNVDEALSDFYTSKPDEERSGLGFTIMRSFMDSLEVQSVPDVGTTIKMTKKLA